MDNIYLTIVLAPLFGAITAGLLGRQLGRVGAHTVTILGVGIACGLSLYNLWLFMTGEAAVYNKTLYTWASIGSLNLEVGFMVDSLTSIMMAVVTFVSLMVHIYTIGYMDHDEENWPKSSRARANSYQRFFSYIALFTFSMLMLVMANNFLQLFFGWEAVGLVSYLLIGFWFNKDTAVFANLKAFLVNRVGDFGFLIGIAAVLMVFGTLNYSEVFMAAPEQADATMELIPGVTWSALSVICIGLFIGAMGKSAQAPLHVWLPDSMEGPTPISALIHAATMVTAGIFMVARMSPLFELSETALSFVLVIGATTAFFTGLIGIVQNDIKRVVAYSTLSQLGYMTAALGASAYSAAIFHLMTHAFFKALLFLGAGSVIIALHHKQDMRQMGGLRKFMPITFITAWLGTLALTGFPGTSGFYSKDAIIESVHAATRWGSDYAYWCVLLGVFVTALYSFRLLYLTFHGKPRMDEHTRAHAKESPWVVTLPLILLAVPSIFIGYFTIEPLLFNGFMDDAITVAAGNDPMGELASIFHGPGAFALHAFVTPAFWLMVGGFTVATGVYMFRPQLAAAAQSALKPLWWVLDRKYGFDAFYQRVFAKGSVGLGKGLSRFADQGLIDGVIVNGSTRVVRWFSDTLRELQSGYLYHYAFATILGLIALVGAFVLMGANT